MTYVKIPKKRKCPGTFDNNGVVGILSFEAQGVKVDVEFSEKKWKEFISDMLRVQWKEREHHGQC